jgi:hypothetical protein
MRIFTVIPTPQKGARLFFAFFCAFQCTLTDAAAADNDQEILNQLYQEIMSSSPAGRPMKGDSAGPLGRGQSADREMAQPPDKAADIASERLRIEIDKIVQDAKVRHSDAVKFMQDSK